MALPKFTKQTKFSSYSGEYLYEDMRGNRWVIKQKDADNVSEARNQWLAYPYADAAKAYELQLGRMFRAASDATMMIDDLEGDIEAARAAGQSPGEFFGHVKRDPFPWWLLLLVAVVLDEKKGRRR